MGSGRRVGKVQAVHVADKRYRSIVPDPSQSVEREQRATAEDTEDAENTKGVHASRYPSEAAPHGEVGPRDG